MFNYLRLPVKILIICVLFLKFRYFDYQSHFIINLICFFGFSILAIDFFKRKIYIQFVLSIIVTLRFFPVYYIGDSNFVDDQIKESLALIILVLISIFFKDKPSKS
jgi:hypothetical protein